MTALDIEEIVELNLDDIVGCEWGKLGDGDDCEREAKWKGVTKCCGFTAVVCEEHKAESQEVLLKVLEALRVAGRVGVCDLCKREIQPPIWTPL